MLNMYHKGLNICLVKTFEANIFLAPEIRRFHNEVKDVKFFRVY